MANRLINRQHQQQQEKDRLAAYAVLSSQSCGRVHPEPEHEYRTCFQRDRDRIIHSAAFRRLEAKTQVFLDPTGDYYRTRLTHTMEVAQVARTMARILSLNEDLAESAALAHDLGHPPFGHCGEAVLNELMADHDGFEHNRHSLRIVEYLEHPYPAFRGLNLTWETRLCLAKHHTHYDNPLPTDEFSTASAPLEGQIADLADAVAYNSHDLDDALACGLLNENDLADVQLYQILKDRIDQQFPHARRHARQLRTAKALIDILALDALHETARRLETANPQSTTDIYQMNENLVDFSPTIRNQLNELEKFLMDRVYLHPEVARAQKQARKELIFLFNHYLTNTAFLPPRYQLRLSEQSPHRVTCDYLAGMTDRFCHQQFLDLMQ
ncbi:MAG: deoxyguanosinetriphosphate triphosphohydrolase [Sedimentisphaerales bacterium]|nr:deoxyguanosinetriphosphate triphosphohydrolase [Sedimentisphaerales bacterium]